MAHIQSYGQGIVENYILINHYNLKKKKSEPLIILP